MDSGHADEIPAGDLKVLGDGRQPTAQRLQANFQRGVVTGQQAVQGVARVGHERIPLVVAKVLEFQQEQGQTIAQDGRVDGVADR